MNTEKSFEISKKEVWKSYKLLKESGLIKKELLKLCELNLKNNLYFLWNRLSSGSYFPPKVDINNLKEKKTEKDNLLEVLDYIAQMLIKKNLDFNFDEYKINNSQNFKQFDWILKIDYTGLHNYIEHDLIIKALRFHTNSRWIILNIKRWIQLPAIMTDGSLQKNDYGISEKKIIGPVLSNLFYHYCLDRWIQNNFPYILFERSLEQAIFLCKNIDETKKLEQALRKRMVECRLPVETIVHFIHVKNINN